MLVRLGLLALVLILGAVDGAYRIVDGDLAVRPSLPAALAALRIDPPVAPRERAASRLRRGDLAGATALAPRGDDPRDIDLRAQIAAARGDVGGAAAAFAAVGDAVRAQAVISALAERGDLARATTAQEALVARLDSTRALVPEAAADAWWRLGVLRATRAWREPPAKRLGDRTEALDAYRHALALSPNEETYLLAVGEGQLEIGDPVGARAAYVRAYDVVPNAVDAAIGIVRADALRGRCDAVRDDLARARAAVQHDGRPWPQTLTTPPSPWDAAVERCMTR